MFIAVGTPSRRGDGHADLTLSSFAAAEEIAGALNGYTVVVTKSTVPVGTSREVEEIIRSARPEAEFDMASNPEFLREGSAIEDFQRPDRVVVGCDTERARAVMHEVYRPLYLNETPILFTSREIRRAHQIRGQCLPCHQDHLHQRDGRSVREGRRRRAGSGARHRARRPHRREVPAAGPGYGGSCFPKDTLALVHTAQRARRARADRGDGVEVNEARKRAMAGKVDAAFGGLAGKTVAVLGLTFKPNTDDMREAPSLVILPLLQAAGATCGPTIRKAQRRRAKLARRGTVHTTPMRRCKAPTAW